MLKTGYMTARTRFCLVLCGIAASVTALYAFQREFRVYASLEGYDNVPLPDDYRVPAEFVFARLMYPQHPNARFGRYRWGSALHPLGEGGTSWTQDYPRADRHFAQAMRRLTRIHARSVNTGEPGRRRRRL